MTVEWEKVHVFISSTFKDMHAERDYLVKRVFPKLSEWCERRRLRLVDIDLRWGVTEQDSQSRNTIKVCLDGIDFCRPFFVCFLGQRRGWVPKYDTNKSDEKNEIPDTTIKDFPVLQEKNYAGSTSATELEIIHALVDPLHRGKQRDPEKPGEYYEPAKFAFFYLREDSYLKQIDRPEVRQIYTNESKDDDRELEKWRTEKIPATGRPKHDYSARWDPKLTTPELGLPGRLTDFQCQASLLDEIILKDLQEAIATRYPDHVESEELTDLQKEIDQQEQFLYASSEGFISRGDDFKELDEYVKGASDQLFVLTAPAGMGKSTLLANWIDRYRSDPHIDHSLESIHFRFIGQSDRSTIVYSLLQMLLRELKEVAGKITEEIPDDPQKLRQELPKLLEAAGRKGKTIIVLDALNQLASGLSDLSWLVYQLPANIKLIVSFKSDDLRAGDLLQQMEGHVIHSRVKPFDELEDRRKLVNEYLKQYLKALDESHLEILINSKGAERPLFLKVVLSELRVFGAFENLPEKIRLDFGETPVSAFEGVLKRLENDPAYSPIKPEQAVSLIFGLLAHAQQGLSAGELTGLMIQALDMEDNESSRQAASDSVYLYLRQVRPFLAYRDGRYDFFFESFRLAAQERFVGEEFPKRPAKEWHKLLAEYFVAQPLKIETNGKKILNRHKLLEQPYQQSYGELWGELRSTLTNFDFLEAKCSSFSVYELEKDYQTGLKNWTGEQSDMDVLKIFEEHLRLESHAINKAPELLFPQLYNYLTWLDGPNGSLHTLCEDARRSHHNWLRMTQDPRPAPPTWLLSLEGHTSMVNAVAVTPDGEQIVSGSMDDTIKVWDLQSGRLLRSLKGHSFGVYSVAVTPDGKKVVSGSGDHTVKVWDLQSGRLLRSLEHTNSVFALAVTPDGSQVISGSQDSTLQVWDLQSGRLLRSLEGHTDKVRTLAVTPDCRQVIAETERTLKVWDFQSGHLLHSLEGGRTYGIYTFTVAITPDGKQVISGSGDNNIKIWDLQSGHLLRSLEGHKNGMNGVAVTPDGRLVVSGSNDHTVKVWDLQSGRLLHTLEGDPHEGRPGNVIAVAVTPDGKQAISGAEDCTVKVWDLQSGRLLRSLEGPGDVCAVAVTPDGVQMISGSSDHGLKVWDLRGGRLIRSIAEHDDKIQAVAVTPNGKQIVSGTFHGFIHIRDLQSGDLIRYLQGNSWACMPVAVTPDGKQIISGTSLNTIMIWNLQNGRLARTIEGHKDNVRAVAVTPNGKQIVSGSKDNTIRIWDLTRGRLLRTLDGHTGSVIAVAVTPNGKQIVSGAEDKTLKIWDLQTGRLLRSQEHTNSVNAVAVTPDSSQVISGSKDHIIKIWDLQSGCLLHSLEGHRSGVSSVTVTPDGKQIVSGARDKTIKIWDLQNSTQLRPLEGHTLRVPALAITPDGAQIASGSWDGTIKVWDLHSNTLLHNLEGHLSYVFAVVITPDGAQVISGSGDKTIKVWDLAGGRLLRSLEGHTDAVQTLAVTPDCSQVVSACGISYGKLRDRTIKVWDLQSGRLLRSLEYTSDVNAVVVTPDGKQIVSTSWDHTIQIWDLESGRWLRSLAGHTASVVALAVSPDGKQIVSGSSDKTIKVWDLQSGSLLDSLEGHASEVHVVAVTADGKQVISASRDNTIKVWQLSSGLSQTLFQNSSSIQCIAFDDHWLASGDVEGRVWIFEWIK